jgi:ABC-type Mn2+/Zn2+ transport system ATPase subunit
MISAKRLGYCYEQKEVFRDVSFQIDRSQVAVVTGRNGAGKSTLLDLIVGDLTPTSGALHVDADIQAQYLPQSNMALGRLTCREAIQLVMGLGRLRRNEFDRFLQDVRSDLVRQRISSVCDLFLWQVSGGERQSILLSIALVQRADLYLLDEPFTSIDAETRPDFIAWIDGLRFDGATVVLVTHSSEDIGSLNPDQQLCLA